MLAIRLQRVGRRNDPSFRVILTDSKRAARTGGFTEVLGSYDARKGSPALKAERISYWISVGAKPSGTVHNLLISEKILEGKKVNVLPKKSPPAKEASKEGHTEEKDIANPSPALPLAGEETSEKSTETPA